MFIILIKQRFYFFLYKECIMQRWNFSKTYIIWLRSFHMPSKAGFVHDLARKWHELGKGARPIFKLISPSPRMANKGAQSSFVNHNKAGMILVVTDGTYKAVFVLSAPILSITSFCTPGAHFQHVPPTPLNLFNIQTSFPD